MTTERFTTVNIIDCLNNKIEGFSEPDLKRAVATFSSIDRNVEAFLKKNAEDFARQHKSVTHLVFSNDLAKLVGYFTLAIKPITVDARKISKTAERAVKKTGRLDEEGATYTVAAFLIGQLGKNFSHSIRGSISGDELLDVALHLLEGVQHDIGGTIAFLEAQNNGKLLSFYQGNGFREFDRRTASYKGGEPAELVQLFKILK